MATYSPRSIVSGDAAQGVDLLAAHHVGLPEVAGFNECHRETVLQRGARPDEGLQDQYDEPGNAVPPGSPGRSGGSGGGGGSFLRNSAAPRSPPTVEKITLTNSVNTLPRTNRAMLKPAFCRSDLEDLAHVLGHVARVQHPLEHALPGAAPS